SWREARDAECEWLSLFNCLGEYDNRVWWSGPGGQLRSRRDTTGAVARSGGGAKAGCGINDSHAGVLSRAARGLPWNLGAGAAGKRRSVRAGPADGADSQHPVKVHRSAIPAAEPSPPRAFLFS